MVMVGMTSTQDLIVPAMEKAMEMAGGGRIKKTLTWTALAALAVGIAVHLVLTPR